MKTQGQGALKRKRRRVETGEVGGRVHTPLEPLVLAATLYELAWILMEQSLHGEKDGHVVIFKKPLPD